MSQKIKGILLCGGNGTRLRPLTFAVNKHLLRVGKLPMLEYPLNKIISAGIRDIHVVTGGENYQAVVKYLGSGSRWDVRITYSIQDKAGGIAEALSLAEPCVSGDKILVVLGDNIFNAGLKEDVKKFKNLKSKSQANLFCYHSNTPERFGVIKYSKEGKVVDIIEKPINPPSNWIITGIYMYTPDVFDVIRTLKPSKRGELEITDVNRFYIKKERVIITPLPGKWTDAGNFETLLKAEEQVQ